MNKRLIAFFALAPTMALTPSIAHASTIGAGDPIRTPVVAKDAAIYKNHALPVGMCTVAAVGERLNNDGTRVPTIVTAGHCTGQPGNHEHADEHSVNDMVVSDIIYAPEYDRDVELGTVDTNKNPLDAPSDPWDIFQTSQWDAPDYSIVNADDDTTLAGGVTSRDENNSERSPYQPITDIHDYPRLANGEVSIDNFGQDVCKDGSRTGRSCGTQIARTNQGIWSYGLNMDQGDSGGLTYDPTTNEALGINSMRVDIGDISVGRSQPLDTAFEDAYGIPDGHVNDYVSLDQSQEPRQDYMSINDTRQLSQEYGEIRHQDNVELVENSVNTSIDVTQQGIDETLNDPYSWESSVNNALEQYGQTSSDVLDIGSQDPQAVIEGASNTFGW